MSWPIPSVGHFTGLPPGAECQGLVVAFPVQHLLEQGIAVTDAAKYFETETGATFLKEEAAVESLLRSS